MRKLSKTQLEAIRSLATGDWGYVKLPTLQALYERRLVHRRADDHKTMAKLTPAGELVAALLSQLDKLDGEFRRLAGAGAYYEKVIAERKRRYKTELADRDQRPILDKVLEALEIAKP